MATELVSIENMFGSNLPTVSAKTITPRWIEYSFSTLETWVRALTVEVSCGSLLVRAIWSSKASSTSISRE